MHFSTSSSKNATHACPICGQNALHRHFGGVRSCKGCSAFFRRTVLLFKNYKCLQNSKCFVFKDHNKHGCQACRFKRCLQQGMKISAVSVSARDLKKDVHVHKTNCLKQIMRSWNSYYVNRYRAVLEFNDDNTACLLQPFFQTPTTFRSYNRAIQVESLVFDEYINNCCLLDYQEGKLKAILHKGFFSTWMTIRLLSINLKVNSALRNNRVHFLDETFLELSVHKHLDFYRQHPSLWSPETMSKSSLRLAQTLNRICKRLRQMRISDVEFGVCAYYLLIKAASKLNATLAEAFKTSGMFNELAFHYRQECEDVAERFGNLMLVLELISDLRHELEEHRILLELNQTDPICYNNHYY